MPPPFYHLYCAMVLWGNERYQDALDEAEDCLRKAPNFGGADTYRAMVLVGLGRFDEAKAQLGPGRQSNSENFRAPSGPPTR